MSKDRYLIQKSEKENHWICADQYNLIVAIWENGKFNETQEIKTLADFDSTNFMQLSRFMRELGDWLQENHSDKI